jgi:putative ABC transport system substrate-binding protein
MHRGSPQDRAARTLIGAARAGACGLLCLLGLCLPFLSTAMAADIAILKSSDIAAYNQAIEGFKAAGPSGAVYTEYDIRGDLELGKKIARKIRASDVTMVVAVGLKAALAAKVEIVDIPIVHMMILDPLKHQLTGANMAGTTMELPIDRQLRMLRSFLPTARRLGMLYDPSKTASRLKEMSALATAHGFQIQGSSVDSEKEVPQQLKALLSTVDALWLVPDSTVLTNESIQFILESALAQHVPVIGFSPEFTRQGAFLSFSANYNEIGRETGLLAKQLFNGEKPMPLNPVPMERARVSVNLKTARFLGLEIPNELNSVIDDTY